jgi:GDPmannose 4,6-dehydratase
MFGGSDYQLNESSLMCPHSPYAVAKLYAYNMCNVYRKSYNMHISNGILFNHGSPMRGFNFIEQKIVYGAVKCISDIKKKIYNDSSIIQLGNIYAKRDIGHAKDYVYAMWLILQQDKPDDYVIATGETYSIKAIAEITFKLLGYKIHWNGSGLNETASIYVDDIFNFYTVIKIDEKYFRPFDVECLIGDASKAKTKLNWTPSVSFEMLINEMIDKCKLKLHL